MQAKRLDGTRAYLSGVAGPVLSTAEARLFRDAPPAGLILFARNCQSAGQIRALVSAFREAIAGRDALILVDQEGGRVQRLKPPLAPVLPPAAAYLAHHPGDVEGAARAARLIARLVAADLRDLGIDTDCAPVLDVPVPGAHDIIGNRAFATDPATVSRLGRAFAEGLMAGSVLAVVKHIPGHGRAMADSHHELPVVRTDRVTLAATDFAPFRDLADLPVAMTAHVVYPVIDRERPASTSEKVVAEIIRGHCGFRGLLMSDDLGMRALSGTMAERTRDVLGAGCDLALHCGGDLTEMQAVAGAAPVLTRDARDRLERALAIIAARPEPFDRAAAETLLAGLVAKVA